MFARPPRSFPRPTLEEVRPMMQGGDGHSPFADEPGNDERPWAVEYPALVIGDRTNLRVLDPTVVELKGIALPRRFAILTSDPARFSPIGAEVGDDGRVTAKTIVRGASGRWNLEPQLRDACRFLALVRDASGKWLYLRHAGEDGWEKRVDALVRFPPRSRRGRDPAEITIATHAWWDAYRHGRSTREAVQEALENASGSETSLASASRAIAAARDEGCIPEWDAKRHPSPARYDDLKQFVDYFVVAHDKRLAWAEDPEGWAGDIPKEPFRALIAEFQLSREGAFRRLALAQRHGFLNRDSIYALYVRSLKKSHLN